MSENKKRKSLKNKNVKPEIKKKKTVHRATKEEILSIAGEYHERDYIKSAKSLRVDLGLTHKQTNFCHNMLIMNNGRQAYIKAGYKCTDASADAGASRLMKNVKVAQYYNYLMDCKEKDKIAGANEIEEFLTDVMRGKVADQYSNIPSITDRKDAAKLLGKRHNLFNDKVEITGQVEHKHTGPSKAEELFVDMFGKKEDEPEEERLIQ